MAKYLITSDSHFNPFTYDELVKPIERMQTMHDAAQEAYDALNLETEAVRQYIGDGDDDRNARAIYDNYSKQLSDFQRDLYENGITASTKRGLSAARSGYAEVARLKNAIESRQNRSKEYWDARHNNPSLVSGRDPGSYGLDNYLADDKFGQDWYSYSGNDFANEVAVDAKTRADELLRDARIDKDPDLKGKLIRIKQEGFTSMEVNHAGDAVESYLSGNGDTSALENLTPEEQILADVLISHIASTGAKDKVDANEFSRLVKYGRSGLSQAIGKTQEQIIDDEIWKQNQAWNMWKRQYDYQINNPKPTGGKSGSGSKKEEAPAEPYSLNTISTYMESKFAKQINKTLDKKFNEPYDDENPIVVTGRDGNASVISSPYDAEKILNELGKKYVEDRYGIDADNPVGKWTLPWNGGTDVKIAKATGGYGGDTGDYIVYKKNKDGKYVEDGELSRAISADIKEYNANLKDWKQKNPDVDLKKLSINKKDRKKIYEQYNLPPELPFEYVPYVLEAMSKQGDVPRATIAGSTDDMATTRENYAKQIISSFNRITNNKGEVSQTDPNAFYLTNGYDKTEIGKKSLAEVFGYKNKNTKEYNSDAISEITMLPDDLEKNFIRATINNTEYALNPAMLGDDLNFAVQSMRQPVYDAKNKMMLPSLNDILLPLNDPAAAIMMGAEESALWNFAAQQYLGDYMRLSVKTTDESGNEGYEFISPAEIVMNPNYRASLRRAAMMYMNNMLADPREYMMQHNFQVRGNTASGATGYNDYTEEQ